MSDGLRLAMRRVERSKERRRDLESEMRAWAESGAYKVVPHLNSETGDTVFYVSELSDITPLTHSLIGEIIHTLRTALDHLAYQLFIVSRTDPLDEGDRIEFPIYDDSKTTESNAFRPIKTLRPEIIEAIRKVNPCKTNQPLLWILHRLDIVDKHRRIVTCHLAHHSVFIRDALRQLLTETGYADMLPVLELRPAFVTSHRTGRRAQVGDILFSAPPGYDKVNEKLHFTFDIAFDESGVIEGKSVIETLDAMIKSVENLITNFEPFLV